MVWFAGHERLMEFLQLARDQADERTPQHVGANGAAEHGKGFARHSGIHRGYHIQAIGLDERLVVVHRRRLQVPLCSLGALCRRLAPAGGTVEDSTSAGLGRSGFAASGSGASGFGGSCVIAIAVISSR